MYKEKNLFPSSNSKDYCFSGKRCIGATPAGNVAVRNLFLELNHFWLVFKPLS